MSIVKSIAVSAVLGLSVMATVVPAQAATPAEVVALLQTRNAQLEAEIAALRAQRNAATPAEANALTSILQQLLVRQSQYQGLQAFIGANAISQVALDNFAQFLQAEISAA